MLNCGVNAMILDNDLRSLDKLEYRRKADYSIWGYLYQFDLAFYDMLCQIEGEDLFISEEIINNPIYEIETIEDYIKYYTYEGKEYVSLAQVKYSSSARDFSHWDVLIGLYYNYLYLTRNNINLNVKSSVFFHIPRKVDIDKEDIKSLGKSVINGAIESLEKVATTLDEAGNFEERIDYVLYNYHSEEKLKKFIEEGLIIRWFPDKNRIKEYIKEKLLLRFNNIFLEFDDNQRKNILYSLGINFIIREWQNKKQRLDICKFSLQDINEFFEDISLLEENIYWNLIINNIQDNIDEVINCIIRHLNRMNYSEYEKKEYEDKFRKYAQSIYTFLIDKLSRRENRYAFLNTINFTLIHSKEEYIELDRFKEYSLFITASSHMQSFIERLINIMNYNNENNFSQDNILENVIIFEDNIVKIKLSYDSREGILFPKSHRNIIDDYYQLSDKLMEQRLKPKVWYFDSGIKKQGKYDYKINKISRNEVNITEPNDDNYYIECMKCLHEIDYLNIEDNHWIFCKRCKDGEDKY